ncbi:MAG: lamin tail domain-containing protein [Patescibacteria group bacterium]
MDWGSRVTYIGSTTLKEKTVTFGIKDTDRANHFSILGRSGSGRGDMLVGMALQDIERGLGVVLLDATGVSTKKLLERIDVSQLGRVIYVDPSDAEYPYSWNIIDDIKALPEAVRFAECTTILADIFALSETPFLAECVRLILEKEDTTLLTLHSLATDEKFRTVFFGDEAAQKSFEEKLKGETDFLRALDEHGKYLAKDTLVRNVIGQKKSKFTLTKLSEGSVVVVDFSRIKLFPTRMTPLTRIFLHGARLSTMQGEAHASLYLHDCVRYVNEDHIEKLFAPRVPLAITVADTLIQESDEDRRLFALSRCASVASFASHPGDKALVERAFSPFAEPDELVKLEPGEFIVALTIDGVRARPFFARSSPLPERKNISFQDIMVRARREYATLRLDVDSQFKGKRDDKDGPPNINSPKGFQDAFKSIFAKQAERAKQQSDGGAPAKDQSPVTPGAVSAKTESAAAQSQPAHSPSAKEIPEDLLKQMLHVVPVSAFALFLVPFFAFAQISFSEIMYDVPGADTGREWIEVTNTGSEAITLDEWKLFEGTVNHSLTLITGGDIPPGGYAVIVENSAKFFADWPSFSGIVYDSVFTLSNVGEELEIRDPDGAPIDRAVYSSEEGAAGDGFSLQRVSSGFVSASPTPGNSIPTQSVSVSPVTPPPTVVEVPQGVVAVRAVTNEYILLANASASDVPLAGWSLFSYGTKYILTHDVIIPANGTVRILHADSGLSGNTPETVLLKFPNGTLASQFTATIGEAATSLLGGSARSGESISSGIKQETYTDTRDNRELITAPAVAVGQSIPDVHPLWGWLVAVLALVGISAAGIIFLKKEDYAEYSIKEIQ